MMNAREAPNEQRNQGRESGGREKENKKRVRTSEERRSDGMGWDGRRNRPAQGTMSNKVKNSNRDSTEIKKIHDGSDKN